MAVAVNAVVSGGGANGGSVTFTQLPPTGDGSQVRVSNIGGGTLGTGGGTWMFWAGTRYKPVNGQAVLDTIDTANTSVAGASEQQLNPNHAAVPANTIGTFDRLRVFLNITKSGTSDTLTFQIKYGTNGTTADAAIATVTLATTNVQFSGWLYFKKVSSTTLQYLGTGLGASTTSLPAATAVGNMDTLPMFMSLTSTLPGGVETCTVQDFVYEWWATDSF